MSENPLEGLYDIDWAALGGEDIPELLECILSGELVLNYPDPDEDRSSGRTLAANPRMAHINKNCRYTDFEYLNEFLGACDFRYFSDVNHGLNELWEHMPVVCSFLMKMLVWNTRAHKPHITRLIHVKLRLFYTILNNEYFLSRHSKGFEVLTKVFQIVQKFIPEMQIMLLPDSDDSHMGGYLHIELIQLLSIVSDMNNDEYGFCDLLIDNFHLLFLEDGIYYGPNDHNYAKSIIMYILSGIYPPNKYRIINYNPKVLRFCELVSKDTSQELFLRFSAAIAYIRHSASPEESVHLFGSEFFIKISKEFSGSPYFDEPDYTFNSVFYVFVDLEYDVYSKIIEKFPPDLKKWLEGKRKNRQKHR
jgi:hypothetical protein